MERKGESSLGIDPWLWCESEDMRHGLSDALLEAALSDSGEIHGLESGTRISVSS
jgi:hypothetical protein